MTQNTPFTIQGFGCYTTSYELKKHPTKVQTSTQLNPVEDIGKKNQSGVVEGNSVGADELLWFEKDNIRKSSDLRRATFNPNSPVHKKHLRYPLFTLIGVVSCLRVLELVSVHFQCCLDVLVTSFLVARKCQNSLVYADKPQTLDPLEDNIRRVIADIRPQMLEKVIENWTSRLDYIRASRGSDIPEIIFNM
ncbi:hypothetical protein TNCV_3370381 [Trichonephila clavipes]|nr:hypothetical protein TNCV_3370381 [Trichonephila clavipes]